MRPQFCRFASLKGISPDIVQERAPAWLD
jgi:hypothetical protein